MATLSEGKFHNLADDNLEDINDAAERSVEDGFDGEFDCTVSMREGCNGDDVHLHRWGVASLDPVEGNINLNWNSQSPSCSKLESVKCWKLLRGQV